MKHRAYKEALEVNNKINYFIYLSECCVRIRAEDLASKNSVCTARMCCGAIRVAPPARAASAAGVRSCAAYLCEYEYGILQ